MIDTSRLTRLLPARMQSQIDAYFEAIEVMFSVKDPKVLGALGPASVRGLLLHRGKQGTPTEMPAAIVSRSQSPCGTCSTIRAPGSDRP